MEPQAENSSASFVGHTVNSFLTKNLNNELENKNTTNYIDFSYLNAQSKMLVETVKIMDGQRKVENTNLSFNTTEESINLKSKPLLWCTQCQTSIPQCDANIRITPNIPSCFSTISTGKID